MRTNLIFDGNNILYRTFFANNKSGEPDDVVISMCIYSALNKMQQYYRVYNADNIVVTFDTSSWRKDFTADLSQCVTNKKYKGFRRVDQTPKQKRLQAMLDEHIVEFGNLLDAMTSVVVLREEKLEGDDLMAGYVQMHGNERNIVISGDRDMMQLLRYNNVEVIDPATSKPRSLDDWNGNADMFLFEKCIRGEAKTNDNIQSSYPRLRRDKIVKAFDDPYAWESIMNHTFSQLEDKGDGEFGDVEYVTGELFEENKILMDLRLQPKHIKIRMVKSIQAALADRGKYDHMNFLRYCHRNNLVNVVNSIGDYKPMLSSGITPSLLSSRS